MTTTTIRAHDRSVKHFGAWTTARKLDVLASRSTVVLDLLLPEIEAGVIEIDVDLDHSLLKLLVPDGTVIDDGDLRRVGRGRVKDWTGTASPGGRVIKLTGEIRSGEVRVHRGGVAILSLLASRAHRQVREAQKAGRLEPAA